MLVVVFSPLSPLHPAVSRKRSGVYICRWHQLADGKLAFTLLIFRTDHERTVLLELLSRFENDERDALFPFAGRPTRDELYAAYQSSHPDRWVDDLSGYANGWSRFCAHDYQAPKQALERAGKRTDWPTGCFKTFSFNDANLAVSHLEWVRFYRSFGLPVALMRNIVHRPVISSGQRSTNIPVDEEETGYIVSTGQALYESSLYYVCWLKEKTLKKAKLDREAWIQNMAPHVTVGFESIQTSFNHMPLCAATEHRDFETDAILPGMVHEDLLGQRNTLSINMVLEFWLRGSVLNPYGSVGGTLMERDSLPL
jgi:hypothetical protein